MTGEQISQVVLEDNINKGSTSFRDLETVDTLEKLCELIVASTKYVRIELEGNLVAMVDLNTKKKSRGQLLKCHKVMFDMSEDIEKAFPCL
ncbi:unnamed protein product, partial [Arabidopsis halleri]